MVFYTTAAESTYKSRGNLSGMCNWPKVSHQNGSFQITHNGLLDEEFENKIERSCDVWLSDYLAGKSLDLCNIVKTLSFSNLIKNK